MSSTRAGFFDLPLELREEIFSYAFLSTSSRQHRQYPTERNSEIKLHLDALARIIKPCSGIFLISKAFRADALSWIYSKVTVLIDLSDVEEPYGKLQKWLKGLRGNEAMFLNNLEVLSSISISHGVLPGSAPCTVVISMPLMTATAVRTFDPVYWSVANAEHWAKDPQFVDYRKNLLVDVDRKLSNVVGDVRSYRTSGRLTGEHVRLIVDACFLASLEPCRKSVTRYEWIGGGRKVYIKRFWDPKAQEEEEKKEEEEEQVEEEDDEKDRKGSVVWEARERIKKLQRILIRGSGALTGSESL